MVRERIVNKSDDLRKREQRIADDFRKWIRPQTDREK
jgi:hypothetical protein